MHVFAICPFEIQAKVQQRVLSSPFIAAIAKERMLVQVFLLGVHGLLAHEKETNADCDQ